MTAAKMWLGALGASSDVSAAPARSPNPGGLLPADQALVSALDRGVSLGLGVFETLLVNDAVPFALTRHLRRLYSGAQSLGIASPTDGYLRSAVASTIAANQGIGLLLRLRITLMAGQGSPAAPFAEAGTTTVLVTATPVAPAAGAVAAHVSQFRRNERSPLAGIKSTSYAANVIALRDAQRLGADEALLLNTRDELCEGTHTNVFVEVDGQLRTPPLGSGCLPGITRQLVLEWCQVHEAPIAGTELARTRECFLTSSVRGIIPVGSIGERDLEAPGPLTKEALAVWRLRSAQDQDP